MANLRYFLGVWLEELRKTSNRIAGNGADRYTRELTNIKKRMPLLVGLGKGAGLAAV